MTLSVVLVTDTRASAVEASVQALVPAVDQVEAAGTEVDILVIDSSGREKVAAFLRAVGGARVVRAAGADRSAALTRALDTVEGDVLWFGGTDACPVPTAIVAMTDAARADRGLVVADPADPAPHVAAPTDLLRRLWAADEVPSGVDPVPELVRRARAAGVPVVPCTGAGVVRERVRRTLDDGSAVIGTATYAGASTVIQRYTPVDRIELGAYCSIADDVRIVLPGGRLYGVDGEQLHLSLRGHHREETASTFPISILVPDEPYDEAPPNAIGERLVIGDDVWIGYGATVLGQVTVGTGSIIGARSLVLADVPPYSVVGGVPARVIRKRFADHVAQRLLRLAWWDWPSPVVQGAHRWFLRPVDQFLDHFDPGSVGADT